MAGEAMIRFSILVPTRDRAALAESCVRAVLSQRDAPSFELLVVDQSRDDATRAAIARTAFEPWSRDVAFLEEEAPSGGAGVPSSEARPNPSRPLVPEERARSVTHPADPVVSPHESHEGVGPGRTEPCRVVWVRSREAGRSRALNAGIPFARGEWIVIIDDDCEPAPDWLASLDAEARLAGPREVIVGRVLPGPVEPGKAVPPATIEDPRPAEYAGRVDRDLVYPNIALPRGVFEEIGTFDVRMGVGTPLPGGEDNDFGYRLLRAGWRILYRPRPTVVHCAWRSEEERAALKRSYGIGQGAFYAKHLAALDPFIAYRFVHDVLRTARATAGALLRGWTGQSRGHRAFLAGLFIGAWRMSVLMTRTGRAGVNEGGRRILAGGEDGTRTRTLAGDERDAPAASAGLGLIVEIELSSGDVVPPDLGRASMAHVLFRWKGSPVGRLIVERGEELPARAFRSVAFEASAAGILTVEIESAGSGAPGPAPTPGSPAEALQRLATLMDVDEAAGLSGPRDRASRGPTEEAVHSAQVGPTAEVPGERSGPVPDRPADGDVNRDRALPAASDVSVIVATRDRPEDLAVCLAALGALAPPPREIVVVDSASRDAASVASVARAAGAHLVRLERPGLSRARNAGAAAASGRILAFLDDDCRVDRLWLENLRAGFADDGVEAVTGLLLPSEIDTPAQRLFVRYSHMDLRGFLPRRFDRAQRPSRYWPIDAWRMGSGGNVAVRAASFERLGGFRLWLGLGTPACGGEDLYLLWSIVHAGGAVVFRPGAMARHRHHRSIEALQRVLYGYGAGHAAYLRAALAAGAPRATVRFYKMSYYADRAARILRSVLGLWPVPAGLVMRELSGAMAGGSLARRAEQEALRESERPAKVAPAAKPTS